MGLGIQVRDWGRTYQSRNKAALMLTLEIYLGQVWLPKIVKPLGSMCWDSSHNLVFESSNLGWRGSSYGQFTTDYPDQDSQ